MMVMVVVMVKKVRTFFHERNLLTIIANKRPSQCYNIHINNSEWIQSQFSKYLQFLQNRSSRWLVRLSLVRKILRSLCLALVILQTKATEEHEGKLFTFTV
jgi:hypothetical protein